VQYVPESLAKIWSAKREERMMTTTNPNAQAAVIASQPEMELEIQRRIASHLTEGNLRIQANQFMTEEDLEKGRLRVLAYQLDL
jgi:hypothetical protein